MTWFKPQPFQEAVRAIEARGANLVETDGWRDLWQDSHATAFTVARSAGYDILRDVYSAVLQAQQQGLTLKEFQAQLTPILQAKGWWGRKETADGDIQLGSARRLGIIYDTNMRTSYAAGRWAQIERVKDRRPYLRYVAILDGRTRPLHRSWHGTILPVDHVWWRTHYPPNGWRCRCTVQQLSQRDLDEFGYEVSDDPQDELITVTNNRTGETDSVPRGIDPGWAYNPGQAALEQNAARALMGKLADTAPDLAAAQAASARFVVPALERELGEWIGDVARDVEGGAPMTTGDRRVVGALDDQVIGYLRAKGYEPSCGAITLSDKDVSHMYRDAKRARGENLPVDELAKLPSILANPRVILWDKRNPGLLYLFDRSSGVGKSVVLVEYPAKVRVDGTRHAIITNTVRTAKIVDNPTTFGNATHFEIIKGEL